MARVATRALSNLEWKIILVGKMDLSVSKISESCPLKPRCHAIPWGYDSCTKHSGHKGLPIPEAVLSHMELGIIVGSLGYF